MALKSKPSVGLFGSTGNLGSIFFREIEKQMSNSDCLVKAIGRPGNIPQYFNINKEGVITSKQGEIPKLIVNLSNSYFPNPTPEQIHEMESVILGVAEVISNTIRKSGCSIITASTYFQYCPTEFRPWSRYSELKSLAKQIIEETAKACGTNFTDFVLYDNYGGLPRNKFVDSLEKTLATGEEIECTEGAQVLNLTHVSDLSAAFISEVYQIMGGKNSGIRTYELKSNFTISLRDLVIKAEIACGRQANIKWGNIPYREREVFELWETGFDIPIGWKPQIEFETYIKKKFQKKIGI